MDIVNYKVTEIVSGVEKFGLHKSVYRVKELGGAGLEGDTRKATSSGVPWKVDSKIKDSLALVVDNYNEVARRELSRDWRANTGHWVSLVRPRPDSKVPITVGGRCLVLGAEVGQAKGSLFSSVVKSIDSRGIGSVLGLRHDVFWIEGESRRAFLKVDGPLLEAHRVQRRFTRFWVPQVLFLRIEARGQVRACNSNW